MRVVALSHQSADHLGGAELSLLALIDAWRADDPAVDVTLIAPSPGGAITEASRVRGLRVVTLPFEGWAVFDVEGGSAQRTLRDRRARAATRALVELLEDLRPDLALTNTLVAPWLAIAAAKAGVPHAWFVREFGETDQGFFFEPDRDACLTELGTLSSLVLANSRAVAEAIERSVHPHTVVVSYPAVDLERVRALGTPADESAFPADARLRAVIAGRLSPAKGQWRAIDAVAALAAAGLRVDLALVGGAADPRYGAVLQRRVRRAGIADRVRFVGERANPFAVVAAADVALTPSDREAFGRSTLEALALGRPVIATGSGGSAELVRDGVDGFLVDPDDPAQLVDRLRRAAADPELLTRLGASARAHADAISASTLRASEVVALLGTLVGAPPARISAERRAWLDRALPPLTSAEVARLERRAAAVRVLRRVGRLVRDPRPAIRRRLGR